MMRPQMKPKTAMSYAPYSGVRRLLSLPSGVVPKPPKPEAPAPPPAAPPGPPATAVEPSEAQVPAAPIRPCPEGLGHGKCWRCDLYPFPDGCAPRVSIAGGRTTTWR